MVAHAALMQARLHCNLQELCGTTSASPGEEWVSPSQIDSFSGQRVPDPCPLAAWLLGSLALWPFPRHVPLCPLPLQPMMKPEPGVPEAWRTEAWRIRITNTFYTCRIIQDLSIPMSHFDVCPIWMTRQYSE